jgi:hypothetical protein
LVTNLLENIVDNLESKEGLTDDDIYSKLMDISAKRESPTTNSTAYYGGTSKNNIQTYKDLYLAYKKRET